MLLLALLRTIFSASGIHSPVPCIAMMHAYEHNFPPLERKYDQNTRVPSKPFVTPNTVDAQGNHQASQAEEVLNWQTQNAVCQNTVLTRIDSKIDSLASKAASCTST
ncbi:hypothetical protein K1719_005584 [Acacia pycnantha]|nr:hypothetical protein K1719_005584 [Acacia pycnantha]